MRCGPALVRRGPGPSLLALCELRQERPDVGSIPTYRAYFLGSWGVCGFGIFGKPS